jgi:hypothetical protein
MEAIMSVGKQASNVRSSSLVVAAKKKAGRMSDERKRKEEKEESGGNMRGEGASLDQWGLIMKMG